ncbi:MAG: hypothetical protein AUK60_06720 [Rhodobacteraceae bacterium CG2_30_10_405]|nr:MAG: hypothetical protein AUK60_06720 [Rhodobacteraceae bacterium CG2_30_10_405]
MRFVRNAIAIVAAVGAGFWAARKLSGGEFSGPMFIRPKAVEQQQLSKGCRLKIGQERLAVPLDRTFPFSAPGG